MLGVCCIRHDRLGVLGVCCIGRDWLGVLGGMLYKA